MSPTPTCPNNGIHGTPDFVESQLGHCGFASSSLRLAEVTLRVLEDVATPGPQHEVDVLHSKFKASCGGDIGIPSL